MLEKQLPRLYSVLSGLVIAAFLGIAIHSFVTLDYEWDFKVLLPYLWQTETNQPGLILTAILGTLRISLISIVLGAILGSVLGLVLVSRERVARTATLVYVDIFRNTPVLVQLYVAYFVVGTAFHLSAEQAAILTLTLFCGAYVADLVRGTLVNFEKGQLDAAKSIGLRPGQIAYRIVGPQVLRRLLPPLVGLFVTLVKDSSLVSVLGILDLTKAALNIVSASLRSFETWFFVAAVYLAINIVLSSFGRYLEHRLSASLR
jgi:polar amino acid transport system permease protein